MIDISKIEMSTDNTLPTLFFFFFVKMNDIWKDLKLKINKTLYTSGRQKKIRSQFEAIFLNAVSVLSKNNWSSKYSEWTTPKKKIVVNFFLCVQCEISNICEAKLFIKCDSKLCTARIYMVWLRLKVWLKISSWKWWTFCRRLNDSHKTIVWLILNGVLWTCQFYRFFDTAKRFKSFTIVILQKKFMM